MADLSKTETRSVNQKRDRLGDRRSSILPERRDTRAPDLRPSGDMRSASRGDVGGAEALMKTLGLVNRAAGDFQQYAENKFKKTEDANAARGAVDQAANKVDEEMVRKSAAYRDSVARGRTATAWNAYSRDLGEELRGIIERQDQLTLEERQDQIRELVSQRFSEFAVNGDSGQLQDFLATPGAMRYLGEKMVEARGNIEVNALQRIEERFNVEAIGHYTQNIRDQADGGKVDLKSALALIPPTVPQDVVRKATMDTVTELSTKLAEEGREVEGLQLIDSILAGHFAVGGSTDDTALEAARGTITPMQIEPSTVAPDAAPAAAPAYSRTSLKAKIAGPESGGNDNATNGMGSSASGRYQFVEGTFKRLYKRVYGATSSQARDAWANKRFDVATQEKLMDQLMMDNEAALTAARLPITDANMYVMHVLGSGDGPKLLKANPDVPVATILSAEVVRQNPTYFGGGKTVGQAYARIASAVGGSATAGGGEFDPVADNPDYVSPGRVLSPIEQYLAAPQAPQGDPIMVGGLALTQQERNSLLELRQRYIEKSKTDWHKKRDEEQTATAHGMMMRVFGQGKPITSQEISDAAEGGTISEPDAITLYRMLQSDWDRQRSEADRMESQADRRQAQAEQETLDAVHAEIMAPVYAGKRTPEQARAMLLQRLSKLPPSVARKALGEISPAISGLEGNADQTPEARDMYELMDDTDRTTFISAATKGLPPSKAKKIGPQASNLMDQAITRANRDVSRGIPPSEAHSRAQNWLNTQLARLRAGAK